VTTATGLSRFAARAADRPARGGTRPRLGADLTPARVLLRRHPRALAAGLAALAVLLGVTAVGTRPAGVPVLVASGWLPSGTRLSPADLLVVSLPTADVPHDALAVPGAALGQLLAGPVDAGEPLTRARLLQRGGLPAGAVLAPVRLADPAVAALLTTGERVDLLAGRSVLAAGVTVVGTPGNGLVLVAAAPAQALALSGASAISALVVAP
jgi:hypothetical protein